MIDTYLQLRHVLRSLWRAPAYMIAAALTLAVGLAGAVAALAPAWDLLGHPFQFRDPERIVCLSGEGAAGAPFLRPLSAPDFWDLQKAVGTLEGAVAVRDSTLDQETAEGTRQLRTALVSPGFFQVLGMPLALGRDFTAPECRPGGERVLVLTHEFWRDSLGGDPGILVRSLVMGGLSFQVVGVLRPQTHLPFFMDDAVAFQPLVFRGGETERAMPSAWVFGRLAKGASLGQLQTELDRLVPSLGPARPAGDRSWGIKAHGLLNYWRARLAPAMAVTTLSGLLILCLACANAAHLLLARNLDRTREWGVRAALGASSRGLGRLVLLEALVLCGLGSLLALPLLAGLQALGVLPTAVLNGSILLPMAAALVASVLLTALLPMRWASRLDLNEALRQGGTASRGSNRLRGGLTVFQFALAFALLVGAGMSLRGLERLRRIDPGYSLKQLSVAMVSLRGNGDFRARGQAFQRQVLATLGSHPAIRSAAMADTRPLVDQGHTGLVWPDSGQGALEAGQHAVSPGYFATLGLPLLRGRLLADSDSTACLVSQRFAQRSWGAADALGRTIHLDQADSPALTVVGVVGDARMSRLVREPVPAVYTAFAQRGPGYITIYLRSGAPAKDLQALVKDAVRMADGQARFREFQSLEARAARELVGPSQLRWQTFAAALLAAALAGVGLAGTLAQAAARQRREWGIRMALGASPASLFALVFRRVAQLLAAGLALGGAFAWALGRVLQHQFQGVDGSDPLLLGLAILGMGLTGLLAGWVPALRAARVLPAEVLRSE